MNSVKEVIVKEKVIAICRKVYDEDLYKLAEALIRGGVNLIEVTFDQANARAIERTSQAIKELCQRFAGQLYVGAGTVLSPEQVEAAYKAGAQYIISPNTDVSVISSTKQLGLVSIPGAMTPTEIILAHNTGADFVKVFPVGWLGMRYIKDIMAPISHVGLVATGGVDENNLREYIEAGFIGAGVGGRLTDKKLIASGDFDGITQRAKSLMAICR